MLKWNNKNADNEEAAVIKDVGENNQINVIETSATNIYSKRPPTLTLHRQPNFIKKSNTTFKFSSTRFKIWLKTNTIIKYVKLNWRRSVVATRQSTTTPKEIVVPDTNKGEVSS